MKRLFLIRSYFSLAETRSIAEIFFVISLHYFASLRKICDIFLIRKSDNPVFFLEKP